MTKRRVRLSRQERAAADKVLKELWEKAYLEGEVRISYPAEQEDGPKAAKSLHQALADYRAKIRKVRLQHVEEWARLSNTSLIKEDERTVVLEKKAASHRSRVHTIINLPKAFPELGLSSGETTATAVPLHSIIEGFKKTGGEP
jgi:hypothetical protein